MQRRRDTYAGVCNHELQFLVSLFPNVNVHADAAGLGKFQRIRQQIGENLP